MNPELSRRDRFARTTRPSPFSALQHAIFRELLRAHEETGTSAMPMGRLVARLAIPVERLDDPCRDLAAMSLLTVSPYVGPIEYVALTVNGVRTARAA